jgi:hypothetical protein
MKARLKSDGSWVDVYDSGEYFYNYDDCVYLEYGTDRKFFGKDLVFEQYRPNDSWDEFRNKAALSILNGLIQKGNSSPTWMVNQAVATADVLIEELKKPKNEEKNQTILKYS